MTKIFNKVESFCGHKLPQTTEDNLYNIHIGPKSPKYPQKKFKIEPISESEEELRKSILRQIRYFNFKPSNSNFNTFCYFGYELLWDQDNQQSQKASIIRMEPFSFLTNKCLYELDIMVLNNEFTLRNRSGGVLSHVLKSGDKLHIPATKQFYICNEDVDATHILLRMPSVLPTFL